MPIIIIDQHNYAGVGKKLALAIATRAEVKYFNIPRNMYSKPLNDALADTDVIVFHIEPGFSDNFEIPPSKLLEKYLGGLKIPKRVPNVVFWAGTLCRVDSMRYLGVSERDRKEYSKRRNYFTHHADVALCSTIDLVRCCDGIQFLGQPEWFPDTLPAKDITKHAILHVRSGPDVTNPFKGTDEICLALSKVKDATILTPPFPTKKDAIMALNERATMAVQSITSYDYGLCYTGLEAISSGALLFSKTPEWWDTPIVRVNDGADLVKKIQYYQKHPWKWQAQRRKQFDWCKANFSYDAIGGKIMDYLHGAGLK